MPSTRKLDILADLRERFGAVSKLGAGNSLFSVGNDAARIYFRFSKVHGRGTGFFGLREIDLRQLEAHNAYICFLLDDESSPVFLPFADFEEIFRQAKPAVDGQYKVQLALRGGQLELYVARQGRFNVEAYVGLEMLERTIMPNRLRPVGSFSHSRIQALLAEIGQLKGYDICVPAGDAAKLEWSVPNRFKLMERIPSGFNDVKSILSEIDVIWVGRSMSRVEALFEVEHTTTIYSGLLRFNDVLLEDPRISRFSIVSDECRRSVFARQLFRPTFRKSGLSEITSFLEYSNVSDWHARLVKATLQKSAATAQ